MTRCIPAILLLLGAVLASAGELRVTADREGAVYRRGETVVFRISSTGPQENRKIAYILRTSGKPNRNGTFTASETPFTVESTLDEPGWTWIQAIPLDDGGKQIESGIRSTGAMVAPLAIAPGMKEPEDFDAFWRKQRRELSRVPAEFTLTPVETPEPRRQEYESFDVKVRCTGAMPVSGCLIRPKNARPGTLRAVVRFHGAGIRTAGRAFWAARGKNVMVFDVNAHGIENFREPSYYRELGRTSLKNYPKRHADDPERFYFRDMYLRALRALEFMKSLPEWDGKTLMVIGGSQGGAQALAAAALDPDVTFCIAGVPAMCDHGAPFVSRQAGWPRLIERKPDGTAENPATAAACGYYDSVNFAKRIRCEVHLSTGFVDTVCVPTSVYAAYNAIPEGVRKAIHTTPDAGHRAPNPEADARQSELLR